MLNLENLVRMLLNRESLVLYCVITYFKPVFMSRDSFFVALNLSYPIVMFIVFNYQIHLLSLCLLFSTSRGQLEVGFPWWKSWSSNIKNKKWVSAVLYVNIHLPSSAVRVYFHTSLWPIRSEERMSQSTQLGRFEAHGISGLNNFYGQISHLTSLRGIFVLFIYRTVLFLHCQWVPMRDP
jgi:hypothetical protein